MSEPSHIEDQSNRFIRQTILPEVGLEGQQKLFQAKVLVVGCGGLANALLPYLASSGVGRIGIVDGDTIELPNLHRQVLFAETHVGQAKVAVAASHLKAFYPSVRVDPMFEFLSAQNALDLFRSYDIIVDATDSISIRYLMSDAAQVTNKPLVHASIHRFQFQLSVFNYQGGPTYRCLYPTAPISTQNCNEAGVLGTTVGIAGLFQAQEVIKLILGRKEVLSGKLMMMDTLNNQQHLFNFERKEGALDAQGFLNRHAAIPAISLRAIDDPNSVLLDVRNSDEDPIIEHPRVKQIELNTLADRISELPKGRSIYTYCATGKRSAQAQRILSDHGFDQAYQLQENAVDVQEIINS